MRRLVAIFKRDKHSPPPLVADRANSSASSSSGSASLYLQTPDDEQHIPASVDRSGSKKSWRSWVKGSSKKVQHNPLPEWSPSHDIADTPPEPSLVDEPDEDLLQSFTILVQNSLHPSPQPPTPFSHHYDSPYIFPKSVNIASVLPASSSLASVAFKRRILHRLQDQQQFFTQSELRSIAPLTSRRITPVPSLKSPPHPFNDAAPSKTLIISQASPGLGKWVSRPCFEDRYDLFVPEQDGTISRRPVVGTDLAVAALEFSESIEAMVDFDLIQDTSPLVIEIPSETVPSQPSPSGHSRNLPYIAVPSPLRNEHNLPPPPSVSATQSAPPAVTTNIEPLVKRGVRFAEDDKDDVIPLGYVLRMKKKREEKAKFLKGEQERRLLEEERVRIEEERRRRDAERAEWENERRAWEKEKRAMDEERRQRKYAEEVVAARLRRESQRAGGVPSLKASDSNAFLGPGSGAGHFPTSASSSTSERNKPPTVRRHSRPAYDDGGSPVYLPRRDASEPNLPTRANTTSAAASVPVTSSPRGSVNSHSPGSSRPPSINRDAPPSAESLSPHPGTRTPSIYSSQEMPSSTEDVKAAVAAAASRAKRNSLAASASRNNSNISLPGERATSYPVWTGSSHSLNNMVPPVPMMPMQMQMMPAFVMMDMPLLPPTPPFMLQQYPRQHGSPGSSGSGGMGGSAKGRLGGSQNSSRERLGSQNSSRERVNVISGSPRSGSGERGSIGERKASEGRSHPPRSSSFPRPESPRHTPSSPTLESGSGSPYRPQHGHAQHASIPGSSSRRSSMPVTPQHAYSQQQRPRQISHDARPPPTHSHSMPMPHASSSQHLQPPSPWTGIPTQSGKLPNGNSNGNGNGRGNGNGNNKTVPPRHLSYSGVRSEGVRQSNMRIEPPRQAKRQTVIS